MVPMLLNQPFAQAKERLEQLGLKARRVAPPAECTEPMQLNRVLSQRPEAGALVKPGSTISLVACQPSLPNRQRQVPDLHGLDLSQAKNLLHSLDLKLRIGYKSDCLDPFLQNKIVEQSPPANSTVKRGTIIRALICRYRP